jgi:multidrug efflux pump subunit AcrB
MPRNLLAAVTTIIGFISFLFGSYLTMVREFGLFMALGVLFALFTSLTLVPAVLAAWSVPLRPAAPAGTFSGHGPHACADDTQHCPPGC